MRDIQPQSPSRAAITAAYRRPEPQAVAALLPAATLPPALAAAAAATARHLVRKLREKPRRGLVETLLREYALSSQEGVALMCLAEALLRIPDNATRDALIRDKIGAGDWASHLGASPSLFVNAATWGLLVTGRLAAAGEATGLAAALQKLLARGGEPVLRAGVNIAMRLMGEQFVLGETIETALAHSRKFEARGYLYSYDMLGEAALTAADAQTYLAQYERAIHAIGEAAAGRGIYAGPGISIKLSALHPRYGRAQRDRVMAELLPRLARLATLARHYDIGVNIDAEEADRLDLSLDLLEALCFEPALAGWHGIGFVVQAYQKRAVFVLDHLIELARRAGRRLMVRLVKGAYWDTEIKRAQIEGLADFPVFTRKIHTDLSYLACARKMLAAPAEIFPQFATHNARTLAAIHAMAGEDFRPGQYEFQCLHGMGEPLYDEVLGANHLNRPCRIYAPVGTHETLLAYLVRRLLENGANSSFVNQLADPDIDIETLIADPVAEARAISPLGAPHEKISSPGALFAPARQNSAGLDLADEAVRADLATALHASLTVPRHAAPMLAGGAAAPVRNPAAPSDIVGTVIPAGPAAIDEAFALALQAAPGWRATSPAARAALLARAADLFEAKRPSLVGLLVREAGKTLPAALGELREAVDFLRYYASEVARDFDNRTHVPLGTVVAISPWNFPLAIFTGQVAAALAAGNVVLAKPAGETPLIAAAAVALLREAGMPPGAVQLLPGDGGVGAALIADPRLRGVLFTGSTEVARGIQARLAGRLSETGQPIPLIAETGGQNALIVDSSALPEQAVADIIASAFDSAGQRCSALRLLLLQEDIAERLLAMLAGALAELKLGRPDDPTTDIGPVISAAARARIAAHFAALRRLGYRITAPLPVPADGEGFFIAPAIIEIPDLSCLGREVFGPVLHVLRYRRAALPELIEAVNQLGYGLTFGVHSRIEATIALGRERINAGNIYVNRNIIGAVVGSQPFGGRGLSGTGPKAGGPLFLRRLLADSPVFAPPAEPAAGLQAFMAHIQARDVDVSGVAPPGGWPEDRLLPGPVGEENVYRLRPRGRVLCRAAGQEGALRQVAAALATGNQALVYCPAGVPALNDLPPGLAALIRLVPDIAPADAALFEGEDADLRDLLAALAAQSHAIVPVHRARPDGSYPLEWLLAEQTITVNTAAAGGNASLMTLV